MKIPRKHTVLHSSCDEEISEDEEIQEEEEIYSDSFEQVKKL